MTPGINYKKQKIPEEIPNINLQSVHGKLLFKNLQEALTTPREGTTRKKDKGMKSATQRTRDKY